MAFVFPFTPTIELVLPFAGDAEFHSLVPGYVHFPCSLQWTRALKRL